MTLKAMLKNLDGLSDSHKALYRKDGDQFILDVEGVEGWALEDVKALKGALLKERTKAEELEKRGETFKDIDPDKARDALKKVDAMKSWTPDEKVKEQIEAKTKELAAQKDAEYAPKVKMLEVTRRAYESLAVDRALEESASKAKFISPKLVLPHLRPGVAVVEKDGQLRVAVIDDQGKPRLHVNKDGSTREVTLDEYVTEKAQDKLFAPLIQGNGSTGTQGRTYDIPNDKPRTVHYSNAEALEKLANSL